MNLLLLPFQLDFMVNAMLMAMLVAVPMALLSCFLVLKGWSLLGDAISHAVFPGVVLAYIIGIPYAIGAFIAGMFCAVSTGFLSSHSRIKQDTLLGVVFAGMFGLGLVLYIEIQAEVHLDHILFGDVLGVTGHDLLLSAVIALVTIGVIAVKWRDLRLYIFDPTHARVIGLRVGLLHYGLLCLISATIVGALQAAGLVLAIAMIIAPGAIAFLVTRQFGSMLLAAIVIAVSSAFAGVYLSFFLDSAPAPTIVLLMSAMFIIAFVRAARQLSRTEAATNAAVSTSPTTSPPNAEDH